MILFLRFKMRKIIHNLKLIFFLQINKTFISQFGREVFGDDIENNIEYFLKTTTILKVLGQGAFGKVVKAYSPIYGVYLAMKYFKDEEKA